MVKIVGIIIRVLKKARNLRNQVMMLHQKDELTFAFFWFNVKIITEFSQHSQ